MVSLKRLALFIALYSIADAASSKQNILGETIGDDVVEPLCHQQAVLNDLDSYSDHVEIFWKDEKSTPEPGWRAQYESSFSQIALNFDDIGTKEALSNITSYKNITFSSFKVLNLPFALNSSLLDLEDENCATSPPNALLGSRAFGSAIPRFYVSSPCSSISPPPSWCQNEFPYHFQPINMVVKPIGLVPDRVYMEFHAWELKGKEVVSLYSGLLIFLGSGRHMLPFKLWMKHWGRGRGIHVLEIKSWGPEGEDWRFSLDDLVVDFLEISLPSDSPKHRSEDI